jgi:protein arginine kinase activator
MSRICPDCGRSWEDARQRGRLGCTGCWKTFRTELAGLLLQAQDADRHVPDTEPVEQARSLRRSRLEAVLQSALAREDYAEAGRVRDLIREDNG